MTISDNLAKLQKNPKFNFQDDFTPPVLTKNAKLPNSSKFSFDDDTFKPPILAKMAKVLKSPKSNFQDDFTTVDQRAGLGFGGWNLCTIVHIS